MSDNVFRQEPQISGNVPPEFKKMMADAKRSTSEQIDQQQQPVMHQQQPVMQPVMHQQQPVMQPVMHQHQPVMQQQFGPGGVPLGPLTKLLDNLQTMSFEAIQLPSRGSFYDNELLKSGVLHVRPMTGAEEEILATPRHVKKNEAIDMIFKRCIEESINSSDLLTIDRNYLLIWLRGISYSPTYEVKVKCPSCENNFDSEIDLNALPVEPCPDDFNLNNLSGTLPKSGYKFSYRLSTGNDELGILHYRERQAKKFVNSTDDTLTYRTALLLNNIEDVTDTKSLQILLKRLPISDVSYLRSLINEPPFGVDTDINLQCSVCGNEFNIDLPLEASFFFPSYKKKEQET
jgi:hypothetical protein